MLRSLQVGGQNEGFWVTVIDMIGFHLSFVLVAAASHY